MHHHALRQDGAAKRSSRRSATFPNLGANPTNDGNIIRVTMPELTEERRKEYVKIVRAQGRRRARSSIRNMRRKAKDDLDALKSEVGEDEIARARERARAAHEVARRRHRRRPEAQRSRTARGLMAHTYDERSRAAPRVRRADPRRAASRQTRADFEAKVARASSPVRRDATRRSPRAHGPQPRSTAIGIGLALGARDGGQPGLINRLFIVFAAVLVGFHRFELASALRHAGRDVPRVRRRRGGRGRRARRVLLRRSRACGSARSAACSLVFVWRLVELARVTATRARRAASRSTFGAGAFIQVYVTFSAASPSSCSPDRRRPVVDARRSSSSWSSVDVGAYATGLRFGKHKLAPHDQPQEDLGGIRGLVDLRRRGVGVLLAIFMLDSPGGSD